MEEEAMAVPAEPVDENQDTLEMCTQIGPYRVDRELGRGAMGVVYLARDHRLDREVAIKALPPHLALYPEYMARFTREARVLASLSHAHVAAIHGLEKVGAQDYLVLEYVPGQTLVERLADGPLPLQEAIGICCQVASGLEAAHQADVIHRDLKPANIRLDAEGRVKILDFGLAKSLAKKDDGEREWSGTRTGAIVGTVNYMSPEQAAGRPAGKQADIWAFGCLLFECLAGQRAFQGDEPWAILAAIAKEQPAWDRLPNGVPTTVVRLLHRCLRKDPQDRLRHIGDARMELEEALRELRDGSASSLFLAPARRPPRGWPRALAAVAAAAVLAAAGWIVRPSPEPRQPVRLAVPVPMDEKLVFGGWDNMAIAPDGRHLAYATNKGLYLRPLGDFAARRLDESEGARNPFFSPDSRWVGFFARQALYKVPLEGGPPIKLCDVPGEGVGASWTTRGTIVYAPRWGGGLWQVADSGGRPEQITRPADGEVSHRWPHVLPDGRTVLYTVKTARLLSFDEARIDAFDLESGESFTLVEGGMSAFLAGKWLFYGRAGQVFAVSFDAAKRKVEGSPVSVLDGIETNEHSGRAYFSVARDGTLVFVPLGTEPETRRHIVEYRTDGTWEQLTTAAQARPFQDLVLSPDGHHLVTKVVEANNNLWLFDVERRTLNRLTYGHGNASTPIWSPDGRSVAFASDLNGFYGIYRTSATADASAGNAVERLFQGEHDAYPTSWTPDGRSIAFTETHPSTGGDIWILTLEGGEIAVRSFVRTSFNEQRARFSPDGAFLAYDTNETGRDEVVVRAFPGPGPKWQVSNGGGTGPQWSRDGRRLFYRRGADILTIDVTLQPTFRAGTPRRLDLETHNRSLIYLDGERVLALESIEPRNDPVRLHVVLGWLDEIRELLDG